MDHCTDRDHARAIELAEHLESPDQDARDLAAHDLWLMAQQFDEEGGCTPYDPEFERQLALAETGTAQYRNALRALAK